MIITSLLLELKVFLFILAIFIILMGILHVITVFRLEQGKLISSDKELMLFGASISYIITMLICGF